MNFYIRVKSNKELSKNYLILKFLFNSKNIEYQNFITFENINTYKIEPIFKYYIKIFKLDDVYLISLICKSPIEEQPIELVDLERLEKMIL